MTHRARYIDAARIAPERRSACWSAIAETPEPERAFRSVLRAAWGRGGTDYAARFRRNRLQRAGHA